MPYTGPPIIIDAIVEDPGQQIVYNTKMQRKGKFSFTTEKGGTYRFCLDYKQLKRTPSTNRIKV